MPWSTMEKAARLAVVLSFLLSSAYGQSVGSIRLVSNLGVTGGTSGRLEFYYNGRWGTVCDDSFGQTEANVACRQLGFSSAYSYGRVGLLGYEQASSSVPIWLDQVDCYYYDTSLLSCSSSINFHDCTHYEDVALSCTYYTGNSISVSGSIGGALAGVVGLIIVIVIIIVALVFIYRGSSRNRQRVRITPNTTVVHPPPQTVVYPPGPQTAPQAAAIPATGYNPDSYAPRPVYMAKNIAIGHAAMAGDTYPHGSTDPQEKPDDKGSLYPDPPPPYYGYSS